MTADPWTRAVREQTGLGLLLPLGDAADTAWITERPAVGVLRDDAGAVGGVHLGDLRIGLAASKPPSAPATSPGALPSALPRSPLRVEGAFEATADRPLPVTAALLRRVLWEAAEDRLGLPVSAVDLTVTGLLDELLPPVEAAAPGPAYGIGPASGTGPVIATAPPAVIAAVLDVPGVVGLTSRLGGLVAHGAQAPAPVQIAVTRGHRALDVARAVGAAVAAVAGPVAVVVTDVAD